MVPQDKNQNLDQLQESEGALSKDNTGEKKTKVISPLAHRTFSYEFLYFRTVLRYPLMWYYLRFPHHDNEIAQKVHDESKQWIN